MRKYYSNHVILDQVLNELSNPKKTDTVQKCLNDIYRLNIYTRMTDHYLINIMSKGIASRLCQAIVNHKDICSDLSK